MASIDLSQSGNPQDPYAMSGSGVAASGSGASNPGGFTYTNGGGNVPGANTSPYTTYFNQGPGIAAAYQKYLGRSITGQLDPTGQNLGEYQSWLGNPNYESGIANSAEAMAYANRGMAANGADPSAGMPPSTSTTSTAPSAPTDPTLGVPAQPTANGSPVGAAAAQPATPSFAGTDVFNDPATQQFESLLNQRIQALDTPFANPDFQPAIDQLHGYLNTLNGPAYTPDQMNLIQTQSSDPLMAQRDAARQQIIQHMAAQGIGPSSGIVQKALMDSDSQFEKMNTTNQANFATQAIGIQKQQQAQAAQLAPLIASLQQQQFSAQDQRANQATSMAEIIPQLAWSRLQGASSAANQNPLNASALISQLLGAQNTGYTQNAQYMQSLISALAPLFGG